MPAPAHSTARTLVRPSMPAFAALYDNRFGIPTFAATDEMLTIAAVSDRASASYAARQQRNVPSRWTASRADHASSVTSCDGCGLIVPATLINASSRPNFSSPAATAASTDAVCVTSSGPASARSPRRSATTPASAASMSPTTTLQSSRTNVSTIAMPMPRAAPLTNATRSSAMAVLRRPWVAGERLRRLHELEPNPVRVDHVHRLAALVRADVRALDLRDGARAAREQAVVHGLDIGHVETEVCGARVRRRGIDRGLLDVPVLEDLEEPVGVRQPEDGHVQLDARIADELLDVLLVAHPARHELEAEHVAVEAHRALEVRDLDADVAEARERQRSPISPSGSSAPVARSQSRSIVVPKPGS